MSPSIFAQEASSELVYIPPLVEGGLGNITGIRASSERPSSAPPPLPDTDPAIYSPTVEGFSSPIRSLYQLLPNATVRLRLGASSTSGFDGSSVSAFSTGLPFVVTHPPVPTQDPVLTAIPPILPPVLTTLLSTLAPTSLSTALSTLASTSLSTLSTITSVAPSLTTTGLPSSSLASSPSTTLGSPSHTTLDMSSVAPSSTSVNTSSSTTLDMSTLESSGTGAPSTSSRGGWNLSSFQYVGLQAESRGINLNNSVAQLAMGNQASINSPYFSASLDTSSGVMSSNSPIGLQASSFTEFRGRIAFGGTYYDFASHAGLLSGNAGTQGRVQYHYLLNSSRGRTLTAIHTASGIVGGVVGGALGALVSQRDIGIALGAGLGRTISTAISQFIPGTGAERVLYIMEIPAISVLNFSYEIPIAASGTLPSLRFEGSIEGSAAVIHTRQSGRQRPNFPSPADQNIELGEMRYRSRVNQGPEEGGRDNLAYVDEGNALGRNHSSASSASARSDTPLNRNKESSA